MRIMLIEDDCTISFGIKSYLENFGDEVSIFENLESTCDINISYFDLIILDVNLPDGSGFDYLKYLREEENIPILVLTVKDSDEDILKGFDLGADEYMTKPFSLPILKARIENIFKRKTISEDSLIYKNLVLDENSKTAKICGTDIKLNSQEFILLEHLLLNRNINLTRENLINYVWGYDLYSVNDNTLTVTIKRLREKLGVYGDRIQTVRGIGYIWKSDKNEE